ncbi:MAG TPA: hypothetical protein VLA13_06820 [Massilibacterium sp.]|nr:hypothetical protein [Massilibacterium sp.]
MKNQINKILEAQKGLTKDSEYIAVFEDETISDILTGGTSSHSSEGNYVRVFRNDHPSDIEAKLESLQEA